VKSIAGESTARFSVGNLENPAHAGMAVVIQKCRCRQPVRQILIAEHGYSSEHAESANEYWIYLSMQGQSPIELIQYTSADS
jgi:hypothetical protein